MIEASDEGKAGGRPITHAKRTCSPPFFRSGLPSGLVARNDIDFIDPASPNDTHEAFERSVQRHGQYVRIREVVQKSQRDGPSPRLDAARHSEPALSRSRDHAVPRLYDPVRSSRKRIQASTLT